MTKEEILKKIAEMRFTYLGKEEENRLKAVLKELNDASGSGTLLQVNDTDNTDQTLLNFTDTSSIIWGDLGDGKVAASIHSGYAGQASIDTLGTIATGTWEGGAIGPGYGGTGLNSYAAGDLLYASAANVLSKLAKGSDGKVLTLVSGLPAWGTPAGGLPSMTGNNGKYLTTDGSAASWNNVSAIAGGSNTQIQFNNSGSLSGENNFVYDNVNKRLGIGAGMGAPGLITPGATLSFGKQPTGVGAWHLYEGGAGLNYGFGFNALEFQQFAPSTAIMSWSSAGQMNATGINEKMRLTMSTGILNVGTGITTGSITATGTIRGGLISSGVTIGPSQYYYDGGAGSRYGAGISANEIQYFIANAGRFTWNKGGDLQSSGTNELMRLSNSGYLVLGATSSPASSILTLVSTTRGFLIPRMNTSQVGTISAPSEALQVYDTTLHGIKLHNGTVWNNIIHSNITNSKVAGTPTSDGYIEVTIGGTNYKLMTTS